MRRIALTQNKYAVVDDTDYSFLTRWKWCAVFQRGQWKAARNIRGERRSQEMLFMHNAIMQSKGIDHRDGDTLNNRRGNLRKATKSQNAQNSKKPVTNTSGFKWVHRANPPCKNNPWTFKITANGVSYSGAYYKTPQEASLDAIKMAMELHGDFFRC